MKLQNRKSQNPQKENSNKRTRITDQRLFGQVFCSVRCLYLQGRAVQTPSPPCDCDPYRLAQIESECMYPFPPGCPTPTMTLNLNLAKNGPTIELLKKAKRAVRVNARCPASSATTDCA